MINVENSCADFFLETIMHFIQDTLMHRSVYLLLKNLKYIVIFSSSFLFCVIIFIFILTHSNV